MYDPVAIECAACGCRWEPNDLAIDAESRCPACESADVALAYPHVPRLESEDLQLIYAAEQRIPRDERGVHLVVDMFAWLRAHGVEDRNDLLMWSEWFHAISSAREAATAERLATKRAEEQEHD